MESGMNNTKCSHLEFNGDRLRFIRDSQERDPKGVVAVPEPAGSVVPRPIVFVTLAAALLVNFERSDAQQLIDSRMVRSAEGIGKACTFLDRFGEG